MIDVLKDDNGGVQVNSMPIDVVLHAIDYGDSVFVPSNEITDQRIGGLLYSTECSGSKGLVDVLECDAAFTFYDTRERSYSDILGTLFLNVGNPFCKVVANGLSSSAAVKINTSSRQRGHYKAILDDTCLVRILSDWASHADAATFQDLGICANKNPTTGNDKDHRCGVAITQPKQQEKDEWEGLVIF